MYLEILTYPDPRLREQASAVKVVDAEIRKLMDDMADTMYAAPGVGLAATQVGVARQVLVIDVEHPKEGQTGRAPSLIQLANPTIVGADGDVTWEEGCLSFPGITEEVDRAAKVMVEGINRDNVKVRIEASGLLAVAFQHEIDHLNGVVFIDHISRLKRKFIERQMLKARKELAEQQL
jgi:peptide deformylase